jgi:hypothetical protein
MFRTRRLAGLSLMLCLAAAVWGFTALPADACVPRFGHVFLIIGENTSYEQITPAHAPFLMGTVKPQGAWLTNDHSFVKSSSLGQ